MLAASPTQRNRLLARLSQRDFQLLKAHLEPVVLKLRHDLEKPNRPIEDVYFMETGIASVVAVQSGEKRVEVGLIGCEGMSGSAVMLGNHRSPHSTYIQVSSTNGWHAGFSWRTIESQAARCRSRTNFFP